MSFVISDNTLGEDINPISNPQSSAFSLGDGVFASSESLDNLPLDLEKQQQHHLRQFLYYQGLALQRQQDQQRLAAISGDFSDTDNFFINSQPSPGTFSSGAGSVEEQLQDFVTNENYSDSSVSAPSTPPDLLGTNIPSLAAIDFNPNDLICSPPALFHTPNFTQSASGSAMSRMPVSPLNDASNVAQHEQEQNNGLQLKQAERELYDRQARVSQDFVNGSAYPMYRHDGIHSQPSMYQPASNQMYMARNRSSSIAAPYLNTYAPPMPTVYISNVQPSLYQQSFMSSSVQSSTMYDGRLMMPLDGGNHQRTFSLPNNNVPMQYGNPILSLPAYQRAQMTDMQNENANIAAEQTPVMDIQGLGLYNNELRIENVKSTSSEAGSGVQRKSTISHRVKPYDRAGSSSRSSVSGITATSSTMAMTFAEQFPKAGPSAAVEGHSDSSAASTPGRTIVLDELKELPAGMVRNPHGGGRGYIPGETPVDPKKKHMCGVCGRGFARLYNLKSHASTHDPARPRPYDCPHANCTRSFSRLHDLERHRQGIHRDGPLMDAKVQGIAPAVARAQTRIAERAANGDLV
ncbi:hypothetical protein QFC21_002065 [Naganishia friedmannii]|uniref:Uncharacterized protein n=1 Tax=Naganishia friedmannii TaxID=89922 RepID=A0ACC2W1Q3_9TREE|nr:hypothetical protein QFC21_002065 [Naganishia friedmannii]